MSPLFAECIGTALLVLLGNGVVANVLLPKTKGHGSGWLVITFGWAMAVFVAVFIAGSISGAHLNPAVTLGLALIGSFDWGNVFGYIMAQLLGAMIGALLVWVQYEAHYKEAKNSAEILATFATGPAIKNTIADFVSEVLGTFVLVFSIFYIASPQIGAQVVTLGALDALPVALLVLGIGLSLGGTTGYAINPARDIMPRLVHWALPKRMIPHKGTSDWKYAWIPVIGPLVGSVLAAVLYLVV